MGMWNKMKSNKVCWFLLGCGLVIGTVGLAVGLTETHVSKNRLVIWENLQKSTAPWETTSYKVNHTKLVHLTPISSPPGWKFTGSSLHAVTNSEAMSTTTVTIAVSTIGRCMTKPCQHGTCENQDGGYNCICLPGWTGQNCQRDIDECTKMPCQHGRCVNQDGGYNCTCNPGWTGQNCQQDINECTKTPCQHGSCVNQNGGYNCICQLGWIGQNCSQAKQCQSGWHKYNSHCYKFMTDVADWSTARSECQQHGAFLASIKDGGENNVIAGLITNAHDETLRAIPTFWLGLREESGQWKWADRTRVDYKNWAPGEPKSVFSPWFVKGENCGSMYYKTGSIGSWQRKCYTSGQWNVEECRSDKPYICEKPI